MRAFVTVISILVGIVTARMLGPSGRGGLALAQSSVTILSPLLCLSLAQSNAYWTAKNPQGLPSLTGNSLALVTVWAIILGCAAAINQITNPEGWLLTLGLLWLWGMMAQQLASTISQGLGWFSWINRIDFITQLALLGVIAGLALKSALTLAAVVLGRALSCAFSGCWQAMAILRRSGRPVVNWQAFLRSGSYGARAYIAGVLGQCIWSFSQIGVSVSQGSVAGGHFAVAAQVSGVLQILPGSLCAVLFPQFVALPSASARQARMRQIIFPCALIFALACLLTALGSFFFLVPIFGPDFSPSLNTIYWMLPGVWFLAVQQLLSILVSSQDVPPGYLVLMAAMVGLNALLSWQLSLLHASLGGAWAFSLTGLTYLLISLPLNRSYLAQMDAEKKEDIA